MIARPVSEAKKGLFFYSGEFNSHSLIVIHYLWLLRFTRHRNNSRQHHVLKLPNYYCIQKALFGVGVGVDQEYISQASLVCESMQIWALLVSCKLPGFQMAAKGGRALGCFEEPIQLTKALQEKKGNGVLLLQFCLNLQRGVSF